tara:strand:+ start:1544 stop:1771 length:228 start_codon:yes stop_codon:yes gene_type:complete
MKYLEIKITDQKYIKIIRSLNSNIASGRKNYNKQYLRVLKNILLTKKYKYLSSKHNFYLKKNKFQKRRNILRIML